MRYALVLIFLSSIVFGGCRHKNADLIDQAPLLSRSIHDGLGREIKLPDNPRRVVSLAPNVTEIIFAIGAQDRLAARSARCDYPEAAANYPAITTYPDLDLPGIAVLKPDLAITTTEIHSEAIIPYFEKAHVPLYMLRYETAADIYKNIEAIADVMGVAERGKMIADSLRRMEDLISKATESEVKYGVMVLVSIKPLMVVGGTSYINEIISKAGGRNVFQDMKDAYPEITPEAIIKAQPEFLILPTDDEQEYSNFASMYPEVFRQVPFAGNNQAFILDPDIVFRPGPRIGECLLELTHILHSKINTDDILNAK